MISAKAFQARARRRRARTAKAGLKPARPTAEDKRFEKLGDAVEKFPIVLGVHRRGRFVMRPAKQPPVF